LNDTNQDLDPSFSRNLALIESELSVLLQEDSRIDSKVLTFIKEICEKFNFSFNQDSKVEEMVAELKLPI